MLPLTGRDRRAVEAASWGAAGFLVLGLHVGAGMWLLTEKPAAEIVMPPPVAIMVEFAPEAIAEVTETQDIAADALASAESQSREAEPVEEVVEETTPPPEEAVAEPEQAAAPLKETPLPIREDAEAQLPAARPEPIADKKTAKIQPQAAMPARKPVEPDKPEPEEPAEIQPPPSPASASAVQAKAKVLEADRTAAPLSNAGIVSAEAVATWQSQLQAHLERHKRNVKGAGRGIASVSFSLDGNGNVLTARLAKSSGIDSLDEEAVAMVERASPVPPPPPGMKRNITVPVRFTKKR
ncbi:energy transducer TonB [Dongia sp.]|uniref:energy transducer TonB family protein n=1 Tax=Dongia sp. TaxID=1977262 RepID=UPI0035B31034